jgi:hypothetical protein
MADELPQQDVYRIWKSQRKPFKFSAGPGMNMSVISHAAKSVIHGDHESVRRMSEEAIEDALERGMVLETPLSFIGCDLYRLFGAFDYYHQRLAQGAPNIPATRKAA